MTHRHGHSADVVQPLNPHETFQVQFKLDSTAYVVVPGHKIRLALSSVHWPFVWPSPQVACLSVHTGCQSKLLLPLREDGEKDAHLQEFEAAGAYDHAVLPVEWRRTPQKARQVNE